MVSLNSIRGIRVCEELAERFQLHLFKTPVIAGSVVRRTYTGSTRSSKRNRRAAEQAVLERNGSKIIVYELQGDLYFATIEQLVRCIQEDLPRLKFLILDGCRLGQANESALTLLHGLQQWLAHSEERLVFAGFPTAISTVFKQYGWQSFSK